jgi:hypothetical protein
MQQRTLQRQHQAEGKSAATGAVARPPKAASGVAPARAPRDIQARMLQQQRTVGNRAVQRRVQASQPKSAAPDHAQTSARTNAQTDIAPPASAPIGSTHVQRAWYNFDIPFTNYQFDPSIEGIKTAAGVVKDAAVSGVEWIVDEIKSVVSAGIDWLTDKWDAVKEFGASAFESVKGAFSNIIGIVKNPLGFLADALMRFDAQSLQAAWQKFSALVTSAANGFKALADGLFGKIGTMWKGIDGFANSLLDRVTGLTNNFLFKKLPDALQTIAFGVIDRLKRLWKTISDGFTALLAKFKAWIDDAIDTVMRFVQRVLSFAINTVIAGIVQFGKIVLFLKSFFANPEPYIAKLAGPSVHAFDGVESRFAGLIGQHFGGGAKSSAPAPGNTTIQRTPDDTVAGAKSSASWSEIGHGVSGAMRSKWNEFKSNPMAIVTGLLMDMFLPVVGNVKDVIQLYKDIKKIVTGPLGAGSLEELWTSLLQILDIPILIYHTIVSILMRSLMLPLIVASFVPHPLVKAIAAAVGYGLLGAFVQSETMNLEQKLLLLKTGATTGAQKNNAYNSIADSLLAFAMTAVIILVMLILHFIANVMKGVYSFVKGKIFPVETKPVEPGKPSSSGDPKAPAESKPVEVPSEDGKRKVRMNEKGKCEVCASPCDEIRRKYAGLITPEIEAKIKLIEDNPKLTPEQQAEALKPIEQELADIKDGKTPARTPDGKRIIKLDSPGRIEATKPVQKGSGMNWSLFDSESKAMFSIVEASVADPAKPGPPQQYLDPKSATLPNGETVKLEGDFSFTDESLKKNQSVWEDLFKKPLEDYSGSLADENLGNFQAEYDTIRASEPGLTPQEIGDAAIRKVSFGAGRGRIGFGKLSVTLKGFGDVEIKAGPNKGKVIKDVPTSVDVSARRG